MRVELLHHTPLEVVIRAIRKCYDSGDRSDSGWVPGLSQEMEWQLGEKDRNLLRRILSEGHGSVLEHLGYTFDIDGISRGCLQELVRHRIASYSVRSTRYTLGRIKQEREFDAGSEETQERAARYLVWCDRPLVNTQAIRALEVVRVGAVNGIPNDQLKYCLPESFKTSLIWTINARSLRNFFDLRLSPRAHWEIKKVAEQIRHRIPETHKIIFESDS